eukprot:403333052
MIQKHLINCGYIDAANSLQRECNLGLDKWEVADNIDLYYIVQDFEEYYEMKFQRKPVLIRKNQNEVDPKKQRVNLPKIGSASSQVNQSRDQMQQNNQQQNIQNQAAVGGILNKAPSSTSYNSGKAPLGKQKTNQPSTGASTNKHSQQEELKDNPFMLEGKNIKNLKKEEVDQVDEFFENRIIKPLPDYSWNPELKELALTIQREIINDNPNVRFHDIIGLDDAKRLLKEAVLMPLKYPHFFTGILEPWKGILLFGPPGTGKTMLAKAVATECRTTFFNMSASTIVSKWRGDSEKLVRLLFEIARFHQPSTIFFDEIDSIMSSRTSSGEHEASRRMKTELLIQLDGLIKSSNERVFLLAASNLPWELDTALLRRLEKRILVPLPSKEAREDMLMKLVPAKMSDNIDYSEFATNLEGYSGSDIRLVCKEAAMKPLRRLMENIELQTDFNTINWSVAADPKSIPSPGPVTNQDFKSALSTTKAAAHTQHLSKYQKWMEEFGSV